MKTATTTLYPVLSRDSHAKRTKIPAFEPEGAIEGRTDGVSAP